MNKDRLMLQLERALLACKRNDMEVAEEIVVELDRDLQRTLQGDRGKKMRQGARASQSVSSPRRPTERSDGFHGNQAVEETGTTRSDVATTYLRAGVNFGEAQNAKHWAQRAKHVRASLKGRTAATTTANEIETWLKELE